jgi:hypothetical protein
MPELEINLRINTNKFISKIYEYKLIDFTH